jgi:DNA-binding NarL/FixJ family response regulator
MHKAVPAIQRDATRVTMRILLVEPQALVRAGLRQVALALDPTCEFVEAIDAEAACVVAAGSADGENGLDAVLVDAGAVSPRDLQRLRAIVPRSVLMVIAAPDDARGLRRFVAAGASAVVPRDAPTEVHTAALRLARFGRACVQNRALDLRRALHSEAAGERSLDFHPTRRQQDVLHLLARDLSNKAIAQALGIGVRTVKGHMTVLLRALGARGRTDAVARARQTISGTANEAGTRLGKSGTVPAARIG